MAIPGGFCHTEPPGELYFIILILRVIIPGGFCHTEPPGELYFWWINKDPGNISRSWINVTRLCHHYQQLLYRLNYTLTSSGLKKFQETLVDPGSVLQEYVTTINHCCPEEILKCYSPGYSYKLLERVEQYQPVV